jgi:hypothetical protein
MKKNRINEIIPEYINQSKKYLKKYFDKITINRYLRDFENTASKDFSKIINSSRTLYKEVKNGREIKSTINLLSSTNLPFYNSIFSNKLYSEIKIENEREKLKKLLKDGLESRKTINLIKLKQVEGNIGETEKKYKNKLTEQIIKKKKNLSCDLEKKKLLSNYSYEQFKLDSQYLDNILSEDEKYISNQLNNYYQNINLVKNLIPNESGEEIKKKKQKIFFSLERLKMLKYKKINVNPINLKKKIQVDDEKMDLKKYNNYFHNPYKRNSNLFLNNNITEQKINNDEMFDTRKVVTQEVNKLISKNNIVNDKKKILNTINLDLPQLNEYSNIIQTKLKERNQKRIDDNLKRGQFLSAEDLRRYNYNQGLKTIFSNRIDNSELEKLYI